MAKDRSPSATRQHHMMNTQQQAIWSDRLGRFVEYETDPNCVATTPTRTDHEPLERRPSGRAQDYLLARARRNFASCEDGQSKKQHQRQPPKPEQGPAHGRPQGGATKVTQKSLEISPTTTKSTLQRPWRVDNYLRQRGSAIGRTSSHWKQQLQERKAIFGTVAVPEDDLSTGHMTDEDEQDYPSSSNRSLGGNGKESSDDSESSYDECNSNNNNNILLVNQHNNSETADEKKDEEEEEDNLEQLTQTLKRRLVLRDLETAVTKVYTGNHVSIVSYGTASLTDQLKRSLYGIPKRNSLAADRDVYQQLRRSLLVEELQSEFVGDNNRNNQSSESDVDGDSDEDEDSFGELAPLHSHDRSVEQEAMELAMGDCKVKRTTSPDIAEEARALLADESSARGLPTTSVKEMQGKDGVPAAAKETSRWGDESENHTIAGIKIHVSQEELDNDVAAIADSHVAQADNDETDEQSCYSEYTISDDEDNASPNDRRSTLKVSNTSRTNSTPIDRRSTIKVSNTQQSQSLEQTFAAANDDDGDSYAEYTVQDSPDTHESDDQSYMEYTVGGDQSYMDITVQENVPQHGHNTMHVTASTLKLLKSRMFSDLPLSLDTPKAGTYGDDASYAEYTVTDATVQQSQSDDQSYLECTVYDDHTQQENQSYMEVTVNETITRPQMTSSQLDVTGANNVQTFADIPDLPTITLHRCCDDDDMTQLTFDDDFDGFDAATEEWEDEKEVTCQTTATPTTYNTNPSDASRSEGSSSSTKASSSQFSESSKQRVASILRDDIWSKDASTVQASLATLANEAAIGPQHRANITRLGGSLAILRAMEANSQNESIQIAACNCLERLALDDPDHPVGEVGGIPAIVEAMKNHGEHVQVLGAACRALVTITGAHHVILSADGAVIALCAAMKSYPDHADIQMDAFVSLGNLCVDHSQRLQELVQAGGITSMTQALQKPWWVSSCKQHEAISTLSILLRCLAGQQESERDLSNKSESGSYSSRNGQRSESQLLGSPDYERNYPMYSNASDDYEEVTVCTEADEATSSNADTFQDAEAKGDEVDGHASWAVPESAELLHYETPIADTPEDVDGKSEEGKVEAEVQQNDTLIADTPEDVELHKNDDGKVDARPLASGEAELPQNDTTSAKEDNGDASASGQDEAELQQKAIVDGVFRTEPEGEVEGPCIMQ